MNIPKEPDLLELSEKKTKKPRFSRRGFVQGLGLGTSVAGAAASQGQASAQTAAAVMGPAAVEVTLTINGKPTRVKVEPRETLLDALRLQLDMTGAKRVCDRATCGACTVIVDGKAAYACSLLAIDMAGRAIQTIEGFAMQAGKPHPVVAAFVNNDAQQCGYCTPGFVVAAKAFLDRNPKPTYDQVKDGLGGNLCRCGTYVGVRKAVLEAAKSARPAPAAAKGGPNA
jgi:xanthine dehydrogenase YagT iron-sulfur-binding subunit